MTSGKGGFDNTVEIRLSDYNKNNAAIRWKILFSYPAVIASLGSTPGMGIQASDGRLDGRVSPAE